MLLRSLSKRWRNIWLIHSVEAVEKKAAHMEWPSFGGAPGMGEC